MECGLVVNFSVGMKRAENLECEIRLRDCNSHGSEDGDVLVLVVTSCGLVGRYRRFG
jgi:hypothetical protein